MRPPHRGSRWPRPSLQHASGAATFASTPSWTRIAEVYETLPSPEQAVDPAVPVLLGQSPGLAEISATPD